MHRLADELTRIKELLIRHPKGMSITEIAAEIGKNKHSAGRYLDILHASGHVDMRVYGMAKVFTLSSRVPLSALLSYTTDIVIVLDQDLRILQANRSFIDLLGIEEGEILQRSIEYILTSDPAIRVLLTQLATVVKEQIEHTDLILDTKPRRFFRSKIIPTVFDDGSGGTTIILEDTTTEHEALQSVKESEEFFRSVADHMSDGLIVSEGEEIIFSNDRIQEIMGYTKEELVRMDHVMLAVPDERSRLQKAMDQASNDVGGMKEIRFWAQRSDGELRYLYIRVSVVPFGDRLRRYILVTDMTQYKLQEEGQQLQITLITQLMTNFPYPIYIINSEGVFLMANNAFCSLIRCETGTVAGKSAYDVMPSEMAEVFCARDKEIVKTDRSTHIHQKVQFFRSDGSLGEVLIKKSPVSAGNIGGVYIFGVVLKECKPPYGLGI